MRSPVSLFWSLSSRITQNTPKLEPDAASPPMSDEQELVIYQDGGQITMTILEAGIRVATCWRTSRSAPHIELVPYLHVLFAGVSSPCNILEFFYLSAAATTLKLRLVSGDVSFIEGTILLKWVSDIQTRAYKDITPRRRFLVVINPHGGSGKAKKLWKETIQPIFAAARCIVHVQYTGPASSLANAATVARNLDISAYDAIVPISGDGIVNELINGLASRPDALSALRMPIAPVPAGSGNALSVNVLGPAKVLDVVFAALNAIKGRPMPIDISSVSQGNTRMYSFLSQAFGLMADLDMGTEWLRRCLGGARFVVGYLYFVLTGRQYEVEITLKIVESDKRAMRETYNTHQHSAETTDKKVSSDVGIPPLAFGTTDSPCPLGVMHDRLEAPLAPGWHTFRIPVQFIMAGKLPWLARDSMMFPLAMDDNLIDVVIIPPRSALSSIKNTEGQEEGKFVWLPDSYYYKVEVYRCTPLEPSGYISIDGESIPHKVFQVENHSGLARIMSIDRRWKGPERIGAQAIQLLD